MMKMMKKHYLNLPSSPKIILACIAMVTLTAGLFYTQIIHNRVASKIQNRERLEVWFAVNSQLVWKYNISDTETIRAVKQYINQQESKLAEDQTKPEYSYPLIGFKSIKRIGNKDYWESDITLFSALYSAELLEIESGSVWKTNLSWSAIEPLLADATKTQMPLAFFPNLFSAATFGGNWNTSLLTPANAVTETKYCIEVRSIDAERISVVLSNPTNMYVEYDLPTHPCAELQTLVNGIWYRIPGADIRHSKAVPGVLIETTLTPGESKNVSIFIDHWKDKFENLPQGHYRWVWQSYSYEFDI